MVPVFGTYDDDWEIANNLSTSNRHSKKLKLEVLTKITRIEEQIRNVKNEQLKLASKLRILESEKESLRKEYNLAKSKQESEKDWVSEKFEWFSRSQHALVNTFKLKDFRPKQIAAINATLSRKDVLLLMPTGGGKSLVYQLPAVLSKGLTLVVSPLLSLIEDQLIALRKLNINAAALNSSSSKQDKKKIYDYMVSGTKPELKLLYVTPEWLAKSKTCMANLQKCHAAKRFERIAIDEVHCCSQWGHDFRPDYKFLGLLKNLFPDIPILGVTATATMNVLLDVQNMLGIPGCVILKASFNRPNLFYHVIQKPATQEACLDHLEKLLSQKYKNQSGIIYVTTIKETEELTKTLRERGLRVKHYHANLEPEQRSTTHQKWLDNKYQAIIGTIAFGMGIDKPDVRFVIHYSMPKSMEGFYQESGRAGRDGQQADCILMFRFADFLRNSAMVNSRTEEKNVQSVLEYCLEPQECRRKSISRHFDEEWEADECDKMCDHCKNCEELCLYDIAPFCRNIHKIIDQANDSNNHLTLLKLLDGLFQTGAKNLRIASMEKPKFSKTQAENIIAFLLVKGYLVLEKSYSAFNVNCYIDKNNEVENGVRIEMLSKQCLGLKRIYA